MSTINFTNCIESIQNPNGRFRTLDGIYPIMDEEGLPKMLAGEYFLSFKTVYANENYILNCLLNASDENCKRLKEISTFVQLINCPHLSDYIYLEKEMLVFDNFDRPHYIDIILHKVPEGKRLDEFVKESLNLGKTEIFSSIILELYKLSEWLNENDFSHGKITTRNLWISPSSNIVLFNYHSSSRNSPYEDIRHLAILACTLYLISCKPDFHYLLTQNDILSSTITSFLDLTESEGPDELKSLLTDILANDPLDVPAAKIAARIKALSEVKPQNLSSLTTMAEGLVKNSHRFNTTPVHSRLKKYIFVGEMHDMLMRAFDGVRWYYLDKNGEVAIEGGFIEACDFSEGRAVVEILTGYGVIDNKGKFIIKPIFEDIEPDYFSNLFIVTKNGLSGLYNRQGEEVIPPMFDQILDSSENVFPVKKNKKFGYINKDGETIIEPCYDDAFGFSGGMARVTLKGRDYLIDTSGKVIDEISSRKPIPKM